MSSLVLSNSQISTVENCSCLTGLKEVDLSNNPISTKEGIEGLFAAQSLSSLDLRGCAVTSIDNYRRWVIARNANLKVLDGKDVTSLERRYAYNLFPEFKPKSETTKPMPATTTPTPPTGTTMTTTTTSASSLSKDDDWFSTSPLDFSLEKTVGSPNSSASKIADDFFAVSPIPKKEVKKVEKEKKEEGKEKKEQKEEEKEGRKPKEEKVSDEKKESKEEQEKEKEEQRNSPPKFNEDFLRLDIIENKKEEKRSFNDDFLGDANSSKLYDNAIISSHEKDNVLDNDVLSGNSFLEQKTKPSSARKVKSSYSKTVMEWEKVEVTVTEPPKKKEEEKAKEVKKKDSLDVVLDNDVVQSHLKEKQRIMEMMQQDEEEGIPKASSKSVEKSINISELFFEDEESRAQAEKQAEEEKKKKEAKGKVVKEAEQIFEESTLHTPFVAGKDDGDDIFKSKRRQSQQADVNMKKFEKKQSRVETYESSLTPAEEGEAVSYPVEQIMAYGKDGERENGRERLVYLFEDRDSFICLKTEICLFV